MQKKVWPIILIVLGSLMLYLSFISIGPVGFIFLALAIGFLGSGIVLIIADKKYKLPVVMTTDERIGRLERENVALREQLGQMLPRLAKLERKLSLKDDI